MSSRSKKRTSQVSETVVQSTPSTSKTTPSRRPPSPTAITRAQEKAELANLNDRFATYIERVRFLEGENSRLSKIIQTQEETVTRETSSIKSLYEAELADARRLLDETAKDKARIQIDLETAKAEAKDYKERWISLKAEQKDKDRRLLAAEGQVSDMQARLGEAVTQRKHWETEYNRMKRELDGIEKQLKATRKQLEDETLSRVDLQNRVQSLKEELDFRSQMHAQELNETRTRSTIEIEEVDSRIADEYESRMKEAIQQMRAENDAVVQATRDEAEAYISRQLSEIRSKSSVSSDDLDRLRGDARQYRMQMEELTVEVNKLQSQNASQEARIRDLVNQMRRMQEEHDATLAERDGEIRALKLHINEQMSEYQDLLEIKIQLDNEIATYKKLLESEEQRLNLSTSSASTSPFGQRSSVRRTLTGRKRKRGDFEGSFMSQSKSSATFEQSASSNGPVQVYETDVHGKFVKLHNSSDEDVSLSGWRLVHSCGDDETVFKFHRTLVIKAQEYCTIWSSDQEAEHSPPHDLVMKGKRFFSGDSMKTALVDSDGNEQATREVIRHMITTQHVTLGDDVDSAYEDEGGADKKDKCSMM